MQHQKKISENKTEITAANTTGCKNAVQLKDNRKTSVIQQKLSEKATAQESTVIQRKNNTGLPDNLKSGIENLSGHSMDDVKVHYNSDKPAQLNAHAYAQGTDIHVASGQEKHLAHEAWHVIQQKQGRVKPTLQMKGKVNVNDDKGLEKEADVMGAKALQMKSAKLNSYIKSVHSNNSNTYQLIGGDQQSVRDDGNRTSVAYQETNEDTITAAKVHIKMWASGIPTLKQFQDATSKFFARRSTDNVLVQIDDLLEKFNQTGITPATKKELAQEMSIACEFWLKKVNKAYTGKKPTGAQNDTINLGGNTLKLKGEEERRSGIFSLALVCAAWLFKNHHQDGLDQIVNDRKLENGGVTGAHGNKDVITWDGRSGRIFPEVAHRADWKNSRHMNEDQDYVVLQNDDQKRTAKLVFRGGVAYRWQEILKSDSSFGVYTSGGEKHFAMDKRGRIYSGTLGALFFHSSLVGFADAISAGMMRVNNGQVVSISNDSGHYIPNIEAMVRVLRQLQRYGVNVNAIQVNRTHVPHLSDKTFTGAQILASEHSKWPDQ